MNNDVYILLKDAPDAKAGSRYIFNEANDLYIKEFDADPLESISKGIPMSKVWGSMVSSYPKNYVENNPEWFVKMQPRKAEIKNIRHHKIHIRGVDKFTYWYEFSSSMQLSLQQLDKVRNGITFLLNQ